MTTINIVMYDSGFCSVTMNYRAGSKTVHQAFNLPYTHIQGAIERFKRRCEGGKP